jgi:hypothetical protein
MANKMKFLSVSPDALGSKNWEEIGKIFGDSNIPATTKESPGLVGISLEKGAQNFKIEVFENGRRAKIQIEATVPGTNRRYSIVPDGSTVPLTEDMRDRVYYRILEPRGLHMNDRWFKPKAVQQQEAEDFVDSD